MSLTGSEIKKLKVCRVKCDKDLMFFTRYFFKQLKNVKFMVNWHHDLIAEKLKRVSNYEVKFLNINIPPRMSKTEMVVNFVARGLGENHLGNYLYITASDDLRSEFSVKVREIVTHPHYVHMYDLELKADQNAKNLWRTKEGGGLKTATIFGQITGFGAGQMIDHNDVDELIDYIRDFEGCIIFDDINKISDAVGLTANNEKVANRIFDTAYSRKNSNDTPIINIQQRAGSEDATYQLLEFFKDDDPETIENLVLPVIFPDGKLLWEWKMPLAEIEKLRTNPKTSHMFASQYMQDPRPREGLVFETEFEEYEELPIEKIETTEGLEDRLLGDSIAAFDTADKGDDNFAGPFVQAVGSHVYLKDVIFNKNELIDQEEPAISKVKLNSTRLLIIETNSAGNYFTGRMRKKTEGVRVFGQWNSANKMGRIRAMAAFITKYLRVPKSKSPEMIKFLDQCYRLLKTAKKADDAPDSLALLFDHLERILKVFE